jgi:sugar phosphate isomerase/epimerase
MPAIGRTTMSQEKISLALYTIRDKLETRSDFEPILKRVREIGYEAVEGSASDPLIDAGEYRRVLDVNGLECCSLHVDESDLRERFPEVVTRAHALRCPTLVYPYLAEKYWSEAGIASVAAFLDDTGARLRREGIRLLYHNHHMEFARVGGRTLLELIYERTDPRNLGAELDTYWIQHGGGDVVEWLGRMSGRTEHLHCKDKVMVGTECLFAEVGEGNLGWTAIIRAARSAGIRWFIVEQDTSRRDTLESAAMSSTRLRSMLRG